MSSTGRAKIKLLANRQLGLNSAEIEGEVADINFKLEEEIAKQGKFKLIIIGSREISRWQKQLEDRVARLDGIEREGSKEIYKFNEAQVTIYYHLEQKTFLKPIRRAKLLKLLGDRDCVQVSEKATKEIKTEIKDKKLYRQIQGALRVADEDYLERLDFQREIEKPLTEAQEVYLNLLKQSFSELDPVEQKTLRQRLQAAWTDFLEELDDMRLGIPLYGGEKRQICAKWAKELSNTFNETVGKVLLEYFPTELSWLNHRTHTDKFVKEEYAPISYLEGDQEPQRGLIGKILHALNPMTWAHYKPARVAFLGSMAVVMIGSIGCQAAMAASGNSMSYFQVEQQIQQLEGEIKELLPRLLST